MRPRRKGMPLSAAYPMAAVLPESGTGTTMSASIGASIDRAAKHQTVGTRKINVFKDTARLRRRRRVKTRADAFGPNNDQFSRLDVAFVGGAEQIKSAGFGSKDDRVLFFASQSRDAAHRQRS